MQHEQLLKVPGDDVACEREQDEVHSYDDDASDDLQDHDQDREERGDQPWVLQGEEDHGPEQLGGIPARNRASR